MNAMPSLRKFLSWGSLAGSEALGVPEGAALVDGFGVLSGQSGVVDGAPVISIDILST